MNYFIFNKDMDYRRGHCANLRIEGGTIEARDPAPGKPGLFLSRVLDSRDKENTWHRLVADGEFGENMAVYMYLYGTDSHGEILRLKEWCKGLDGDRGNEGGGFTVEALGRFEHLRQMTVRNPQDLLLHRIKGRYLWFAVALHGNGSSSPVIRSLRLDFPKETWMQYLPEVYQGEKGAFLERYLSVFQSIYDDMGEKIGENAAYLDLKAASPEFLIWLSQWIGTDNSHLWKPSRLKEYLKSGAAVYERLGTPGALASMVEIYTGIKPYLKENGPGENPHLFRLYIPEKAVASPREYQALLRVIGEGKPADMEVQVIALKPYIFLDQNTYLGINSVLNQYGAGVLDNGSSIPYAVLGGR